MAMINSSYAMLHGYVFASMTISCNFVPGGNPYGKYRIDGDQRLEIKRFTQSDIAKYIAEYSISGSLVAVRVISYSNELPLPTKEPNRT